MKPAKVAREIDELLRAAGTPERAVGEKAYLKSDLEFCGVSLPAMRKAVRSGGIRARSVTTTWCAGGGKPLFDAEARRLMRAYRDRRPAR